MGTPTGDRLTTRRKRPSTVSVKERAHRHLASKAVARGLSLEVPRSKLCSPAPVVIVSPWYCPPIVPGNNDDISGGRWHPQIAQFCTDVQSNLRERLFHNVGEDCPAGASG